jgi:putative acetyltransferase
LALIRIQTIDPRDEDVRLLIKQLDNYQLSIYPEESNHLDPADALASANVYFIGAYEGDELLGIGAVKMMKNDNDYGEIKRVFVSEYSRGKGVSKLIMNDLESYVAGIGVETIRLETGIYQPEAIALYEKFGYLHRSSFGAYPTDDPMSVFMEKSLL